LKSSLLPDTVGRVRADNDITTTSTTQQRQQGDSRQEEEYGSHPRCTML